jgi:hypothetical protein
MEKIYIFLQKLAGAFKRYFFGKTEDRGTTDPKPTPELMCILLQLDKDY